MGAKVESNKMAVSNDFFRIWQWNCRGFLKKKAPLQQYIRSNPEKPHVILIQETLSAEVNLSGYQSIIGPSGGRGVCTLVSRKLTYIIHDLGMATCKAEHVMIEILPGQLRRHSVFILNVYSSPNDLRQRFKALLRKAISLAGTNPLVIAGDFNAPHYTWGYMYNTVKGKELWQNATDLDLTLVTDKSFPTRLGTSSCRDSTPDLTFVKNLSKAQWTNTAVDLGSDHYILATHFPTTPKRQKEFFFTDWDKFRKIRNERPPPTTRLSLEQWMDQIREDIKSNTHNICTDLPVEKMDSRLAHLLEAKQSLLNRWKGQRLNRRLRKKIAELNRTIEEYCHTLSKQQWDEVCNSVDGQMRNGRNWNLLKHLLDDTNTRSNQQHVMAKLLHTATRVKTTEEVLNSLVEKYLPVGPRQETSVAYADYLGPPNSDLDADISTEEVRRALHELNSKSAPGPDGITNRTLRNLDDHSIAYLTEVINEAWKEGKVPEAWKQALTVLIPKPGKSSSLDNLRPISLTSCVGKVAEHVILNRLTWFIEHEELYPHTMIGFRAGLSTQDAMKLIKCQIIDNDTRDTRAILGLDLEKAFDKISHPFILQSISELGLGVRFHDYVRSFLHRRRATLRAGDMMAEEVELGTRGTPQGSVISPTLFNLTMIGLSRTLSRVEGIRHTIYADDITIWCVGGSDGQVESALQEAIEVTENYLRPTGLNCSAKKSELLLYRPIRRGRKPMGWIPLSDSTISLRTGKGDKIPRVDAIRILGMVVESTGSNAQTISKLTTKTENAVRLIRRVANRHHGLKEDNLLRLINAFVLCHFAYVAAMHRWQRAERNKLNTLLRKITKRALGIPIFTNTNRLLQLGVHNTLEEIAEAQERAQLARLSTTAAGRRILQELGYPPSAEAPRKCQLPRDIRDLISVSPIPRNVHPEYNKDRRKARASTILKQIQAEGRRACFVDAAAYWKGCSFSAVVVDSKQRLTNCASVRTGDPAIAEQVAIALAMLDDSSDVIYSDSRLAIRAFQCGVISEQAFGLLRKAGPDRIKHHLLTWFPAHVGHMVGVPTNLNETAHAAARALTDRAGAVTAEERVTDGRDAPATYNELIKHFYLSRRQYPPPHPKLTRPQALTFRLLQTETYPNLFTLHAIYPEIHTDNACPACGNRSTLSHMLWGCIFIASPDLSSARWEAAFRSPLLAEQRWAVQQAHDAAGRLGLSVPTWERPATC